MRRHSDDQDSDSALRLSIITGATDDNPEHRNADEVLEPVSRPRHIGDVFPIISILFVLALATGVIIALHVASIVIGNALVEAAGEMKIPWWNKHLAMVVSLCISSLLGGLAVYLRIKKVDVILASMLRPNGTRGDVFLDLMDGWVTSVRALLTFDSPVSTSLFVIAAVLLQFVPAFSGLCVNTSAAMWQKASNLTVTEIAPITMDYIGQLQFSSAVVNLERLFFKGQIFPTNFVSPSNDIATANNYDNATLTAFKVTPTCNLNQTNYVVNMPYNGINYVDLNILPLRGNLVTGGMLQGQTNNGVITGASLYWKQYFLKKAYNYGTYPNGTDFVDQVVVFVNSTAPGSTQSNYTQIRGWLCRVNFESYQVAVDNTTTKSGAIYMNIPTIIQPGPNPSQIMYNDGGQGLIRANVTAGQFLGLAPFMSGGIPTTRALGYQKYLDNYFDTNGNGTHLTGHHLSLHLGDIALTLQMLSISGSRVNTTALRNGTTAYTTINIEGAMSLLGVAWLLAFLLLAGVWSAQRLRWPAAGSSVAILSMTATKSFAEAVQPYSFGNWEGMRREIGLTRWRLGKIYSSDDKGKHYGLSNSTFSE